MSISQTQMEIQPVPCFEKCLPTFYNCWLSVNYGQQSEHFVDRLKNVIVLYRSILLSIKLENEAKTPLDMTKQYW